jgi:N-acetyl-D-muramate 6-phosphate phosphatase
VSLAAVLLDLDGTLVDTAPDLVAVLNRLLRESGRPRMPYAIARNEVSNGASGLLRLGLGKTGGSVEEVERLRPRFLEIYAGHLANGSRLFIGLNDLDDIGSRFKLGVVTNKPDAYTKPLLATMDLTPRVASVVSGDRLPQRKPDPAPLRLAASELGLPANRCVYVGDAPRDIEAGRAAGMATIAAAYGYIRPSEDPYAWGADVVIRRPNDLGEALASLRGTA